MTGKLLRKTPSPPMLTDFAKSSTRIQMRIAYLDGKRPAIVTQTGLYENEVFTAVAGAQSDRRLLVALRAGDAAPAQSGGYRAMKRCCAIEGAS